MIVITGTGRSGTAFLVKLYQRLGFDVFDTTGRAEMLDWDRAIMEGLNLSILGAPGQMHLPLQESYSSEELMQWDKVAHLAELHGDALRGYAERNRVVKDPRFMWTVPVWAKAGADIEHVTLSLRKFESVTESFMEFPATWIHKSGEDLIGYTYGVGLCVSTCVFYEIPFELVHYPHYVQIPESLYYYLKFPEPVSQERFMGAFKQVYDPKMVHNWA